MSGAHPGPDASGTKPDAGAVLRLDGIAKRFGDVTACADVSLTFAPREVHALLGENGAGKSTVCSIAAGFYRPDAGRVLLDDAVVDLRSPRAALDAGIGMSHQELRLVETQTVAQNLALADPDLPLLPGSDRLRAAVGAIGERLGWELDADRPVWQLSLGERQRLEIARLLARDVRVLFLDEPTAVLSPQEIDSLFDTLRQLAERGVAIVLVTHKLREVMAVADRVTVMRRGRVVAQTEPGEVTAGDLAELMVGSALAADDAVAGAARGPAADGAEAGAVEAGPATAAAGDSRTATDAPAPPALRLDGVTVVDEFRQPRLHAVSLTVRGGEILGVAGVAGNGQRELADVIAGLVRPAAGTVALDGRAVEQLPVHRRAELGLAYIPEDRARTGLASGMTLAENLALRDRGRLLVGRRAMRARAAALMDRFAIQAESADTDVATLSGGNKQKVILARELSTQPKAIVAAAPTRGLDVAAARFAEDLLRAERARGAAVLLISDDLDQLLALSDRLVVLHTGRLVGEVDPEAVGARQEAGRLMAGVEA